jgi:hypothetical protein
MKRTIPKNVKHVDWEKVDEYLLAGCKGTEIAPHFNMHHDTFYRKVEEKHKVSFTAYAARKKEQGDSMLRKAQFDKAVKGDNTMLIWLGKNRLKQREGEVIDEVKMLEIIHDACERRNSDKSSQRPGLEAKQPLQDKDAGQAHNTV